MRFQARNIMAAIAITFAVASSAVAQERRVLSDAPPAAETLDANMVVPRFDVKDVSGRIIRGKDMEGWIILYGFGTEATADRALDGLKSLAKEAPSVKGVLYICVADTTAHNTPALRPFVRKLLKKEYRKQLDKLREKYKEWGVEPAVPLEDMYYVVADMKGDLFKMFGIENQKDKPHLFIMDGNYKMRGHYTEFNEVVARDYKIVLAERDAHPQVALKSEARKKKTWVKYALGAVGIGLVVALTD